MIPPVPRWKIPQDLKTVIDNHDDQIWENDDWLPIMLTVMGGTTYADREIELAWQIAYEPEGCDGYQFLDRTLAVVSEVAPDLSDDLHCGDTEQATLVIWVESESNCRRLLEIIWPSVFHS
jgi:hypothetical protein